MAPLIENVRSVMVARSRGDRPLCFACGRAIVSRDDALRMRGGSVVHRSCATYAVRRDRSR
jgi:hypothetical protein